MLATHRIRDCINDRLRRAVIAFGVLLFAAPVFVSTAQEKKPQDPGQEKKPQEQVKKGDLEKKDDTKIPTGDEIKKQAKTDVKITPVEAICEFAIIAYGGRKQLETVRAASIEEGTIRLVTETGDLTGKYLLRLLRRPKTWEDLLRVDLELVPPGSTDRPGSDAIKYTVAFNGASVWSAQNGQYITPKPEAEMAFKAQLSREYWALLRYREDGSKVELKGPETVVGIETNVVDLTSPSGEKTRFWVSTKSYRIIHCEYQLMLPGTSNPTTYRLGYYYSPIRVIQNTLVPTRRVMFQDGKLVQEITIGTVSLSAKIDPEVFQHLQEQ